MSQSALLALRITSDLASMRNAAAIADEHPEDARNQRCADALRALADVIEEDHDQSLVV